VNVADTPDEARRFLGEKGWTWPQLHDPDRELARSLGATYQPHVILFDAAGELVGSFEGGGTAAEWEALLERA
jgi:thioredoxin-related protein